MASRTDKFFNDGIDDPVVLVNRRRTVIVAAADRAQALNDQALMTDNENDPMANDPSQY